MLVMCWLVRVGECMMVRVEGVVDDLGRSRNVKSRRVRWGV